MSAEVTEPRRAVAVVVKGYPRLSETFIAQELLALERRGLPIAIVSLRHPTEDRVHDLHDAIAAPVRYLPEYLHDDPARVLRGWRAARRLPGYARALRTWLRDLARDPTPNRVRRFGQAMVLAAELPDLAVAGSPVAHLYAHFLHTPGSVARYCALMTGLPWSVSAHARDIWTIPDWEKREKIADADWVVTCTEAGCRHLRELAPGAAAERVALVYHGIDLARFDAPDTAASGTDGRTADRPLRILSVGRLVAKKGYDDLLAALALLPEDLHWRFEHVGGGALDAELRARADDLGLADRVRWHGGQSAAAVRAAYRSADLFVLASKTAGDGDRDGLPNVLMEAQSQALCCLATRAGAIAELIEDGETGVLVPAGDPGALADAVRRLAADPLLRRRLARAGQRRVRARFDAGRLLDELADRFGLPPAGPEAQALRGGARRAS